MLIITMGQPPQHRIEINGSRFEKMQSKHIYFTRSSNCVSCAEWNFFTKDFCEDRVKI